MASSRTAAAPAVEWLPGRLLADDTGGEPRHPPFALLVLNQPLRNLGVVKTLWRNASAHYAADGGANRLLDAMDADADLAACVTNQHLGAIIGDLDSLRPAVRAFFAAGPSPTRIVHDPSVTTTDFAKAVSYIRACHHHHHHHHHHKPPLDIVALGSLAGRVDQGLAQLHHLFLFQPDADPAYAAGRLYLVSEENMTFLLKGGMWHRIRVREECAQGAAREGVFDKYVGVLPVRQRSVITTRGLEWDVERWETEMGAMVSTSNHVLPGTRVVHVETERDVVFTIALRETG